MVSQEKLIKQIQFPKLVLPVAATTAGVVGFVFGLIPLGGIMLLYADRISPFLLLIPVIAFVQYVFTLGMALLVSAINVFFRDLGNVLRHVLRLWFYLSPALYSMAVLDASATFQQNPLLRTLAHANPFAVLFEAYRAVIYGQPDGAAARPRLGGAVPAPRRERRAASASARSSSSASSRRTRRSSDRWPSRPRRPVSAASPHAIDALDLGVRYSLRFTKKTTLRQSLGQMFSRDIGRAVLGAPERVVRPRARRVARGHRAQRRRQIHAPAGPGRDHPAVRGLGRGPRATSRAC